MKIRLLLAVFLLAAVLPAYAAPKCVTAEEASRMPNQDVCVTAHIYNVVELPNGTRFLDVCPPETADENCHFTFISYWQDRDEVGELRRYRDREVRVRGLVRTVHGHAEIVIHHLRQFSGGPPRFRPNPLLMGGFQPEQQRPAIHDPNLRTQGGGRGFMNQRDQVERSGRP